MSVEVERFFSEQSPLAAEVASFRPRAQQREMALKVSEAIHDNAILVVKTRTDEAFVSIDKGEYLLNFR